MNTEIRILELLRITGGAVHTNVIRDALSDTNTEELEQAIQWLYRNDLIRVSRHNFNKIILTEKGTEALQESKKQQDDEQLKADNKKADDVRNLKFQLFHTIVGAVIGALITFLFQLF